MDKDINEIFRTFILSDFREISNPFCLPEKGNSHHFSNIELLANVLIDFLLLKCEEDRLKSVGKDFFEAFQRFNDAQYTDITKRGRAIQDIALRFEAFIKKVTYYLYPNTDKWHPALDGLLKTALPSLNSNIKQTENTYWANQPVMDAVVRDTYHLRHPSAHEAWEHTTRKIDRDIHSVIASYLFVVAHHLDFLRKITSPLSTPNFISDYLEKLRNDKRIHVWRDRYTPLSLSTKNYPEQELEPFDLLVSEYSDEDDSGLEEEQDSLSDNSGDAGEISEDDTGEHEEEQGAIYEIVAKYHHLVILGEAGAGKSTTLRKLALNYYDEIFKRGENFTNTTIPVYIELSSYFNSIKELVRITLGTDDASSLIESLKVGQYAFFLDGLNEITTNKYRDAISDIKSFISEFSNNRYVISSRREGYHNELKIKTFEINSLSDGQINEYIMRYLGKEQGNELWYRIQKLSLNLGRNPLILTMLVQVFIKSDSQIKNKAELFRKFIDWMFAREESKGIQIPRQIMKGLLTELGFRMQQSGKVNIIEDAAREIIAEQLDKMSEYSVSPIRALIELVDSGFLARVLPDGIRFFHQAAQEYFAALKVQSLIGQSESILDGILLSDSWDEVTVMLAGLIDPADHILDILLKRNRVILAVRCFVSAHNCSDDIAPRLYQTLENGLRSSNVDELLITISALGELRTQKALSLLREAIVLSVSQRERRKHLRTQIVQALENYEFGDLLEFLEEYTSEEWYRQKSNRHIGIHVFLIVTKLNHAESANFLLQKIQSQDDQISTDASSAIAWSNRKDLIPALIDLAKNARSASVSERATYCLSVMARWSIELIEPALLKLSKSANPTIVRRSISGLKNSQNKDAIERILLSIETTDSDLQRLSIRALTDIKPK